MPSPIRNLIIFFKRILYQQLQFTVTSLSISYTFCGKVWWSMVVMVTRYDAINSTRSSHCLVKLHCSFGEIAWEKFPKGSDWYIRPHYVTFSCYFEKFQYFKKIQDGRLPSHGHVPDLSRTCGSHRHERDLGTNHQNIPAN